MKIRFFLALGMVLLLSPMLALAQTTCANPTVVQPNGEATNFDFVAQSSSNFYQFNVQPNRSYSVSVRQNYDLVNTDLTPGGGGGVLVYPDAACVAAPVALNDTTGSEPPMPANAFRGSFVTPNVVANKSYRIKVTNGNAATGRYIEVIVAETTKFSPVYTTYSGYNNFYRVYNTTSNPITGTLSAFDTNGAPIGTPVTMTIPPYTSSPTTYTGAGAAQLNILPGNSGPVIWVDNGPPGGTLIDGFAWNGNGSFPVKFTGVRDGQ